MDEQERRERLEAVESARASRAVLLSIAVPPTGTIEDVRRRIEEERAAVEHLGEAIATPAKGALERARRVLREYDSVPENGLVLYTGVVDGSVTDFVFDDLPQPVHGWTFAREEEFVLEPLETVIDDQSAYGLLVVERGGAALGRHDGTETTVVDTFGSDVPQTNRAGGQSADRFERRRQERKEAFLESVAAAAEQAFLDDGVDALALGGTEITVEQFHGGDYLHPRLRDLVVDTYHVEYANEQGLRQLAAQASEDLPVDRRGREALDDFFAALGDEDDPVAYGHESVDRALTFDAVETLLLSADLPVEERLELEERAEAEGGEVVLVPTDTDRGERFHEAFGGVAARCRFPVE